MDYSVLDLSQEKWLKEIKGKKPHFCLAKPSPLNSTYNIMYNERVRIISEILKIPVFPSYKEISLYENKKFLSYWLEANKIPHPKTYVFYNENEALSYVKKIKYPIVAKLNIGASGRGIKMINSFSDVKNYVRKAFTKGLSSSSGPNLSYGNYLKRLLPYISDPKSLYEKIKKYENAKNVQYGFVIFQEYIEHNYEWRVVKIGESYFVHKKVKIGEKASGSLVKKYDNPPLKLLDFVREIVIKHKFNSVAFDCFETSGRFLVNEIQCIFGQSDSYQMLVDGVAGRFIYGENGWIFEKGDFNKNESYNLRIEYVLSQLKGK